MDTPAKRPVRQVNPSTTVQHGHSQDVTCKKHGRLQRYTKKTHNLSQILRKNTPFVSEDKHERGIQNP